MELAREKESIRRHECFLNNRNEVAKREKKAILIAHNEDLITQVIDKKTKQVQSLSKLSPYEISHQSNKLGPNLLSRVYSAAKV